MGASGPEPAKPKAIGDYRLETLLGAGATSRVYLGIHERLGRKAAIKVLAPDLADEPVVVERLLREARVVNDIRHPNIIDISDFIDQQAPRRVALIMEYIEGPSLRIAKEKRLEFGQSTALCLQLVAALEAAHGAGIIHRDLKPDNILLTTDPFAAPDAVPILKVVDFGLAKVVGILPNKPATGVMIGTPAYMAPEQIAGTPPSSATDVYAVGEILFELLAGRRFFPKASVSETIRRKLRGPIPDVDLPDLPHRDMLARIIGRCVNLLPKDRPKLLEVRDALLDACPSAYLSIGRGTWGRRLDDADRLTRAGLPRKSLDELQTIEAEEEEPPPEPTVSEIGEPESPTRPTALGAAPAEDRTKPAILRTEVSTQPDPEEGPTQNPTEPGHPSPLNPPEEQPDTRTTDVDPFDDAPTRLSTSEDAQMPEPILPQTVVPSGDGWSVPGPAKRSGFPLQAFVIGGLSAAGLGLAVLASMQNGDATQVDPALTKPKTAGVAKAEPSVAVSPRVTTVRLESRPSGAKIRRMDTKELLGTTPYDVVFDDGAVRLDVELELEGFRNQSATLSPDEPVRTIAMRKSRARPKKKPTGQQDGWEW